MKLVVVDRVGSYLCGAILCGAPMAALGLMAIYAEQETKTHYLQQGHGLGGPPIGAMIWLVLWLVVQPLAALVGGLLAMKLVKRWLAAGRTTAIRRMATAGYVLLAAYIGGHWLWYAAYSRLEDAAAAAVSAPQASGRHR